MRTGASILPDLHSPHVPTLLETGDLIDGERLGVDKPDSDEGCIPQVQLCQRTEAVVLANSKSKTASKMFVDPNPRPNIFICKNRIKMQTNAHNMNMYTNVHNIKENQNESIILLEVPTALRTTVDRCNPTHLHRVQHAMLACSQSGDPGSMAWSKTAHGRIPNGITRCNINVLAECKMSKLTISISRAGGL